jgi:hypothetical protein
MVCITLQTKTGPEEYQVSDLDEVSLVENRKWPSSNNILYIGNLLLTVGLN